MSITFKSLKSTDFHLVKNIYDYYIQYSTATFHTELITYEQLQEFIFINHPLYPSYLIYLDDAVIGYCYLTAYRNRQAYRRSAELTVYLKQEYTGKGLGAAILDFLEQEAVANGLKNLLATIAGNNQASIKLFENKGYIKCAHFKNIGEKFGQILDVVIFQKEI